MDPLPSRRRPIWRPSRTMLAVAIGALFMLSGLGGLTASPVRTGTPLPVPAHPLPAAIPLPALLPGPRSNSATPHLTADGHLLGPRPQSWHGRTVPPGAPVPRAGAPFHSLVPTGAPTSVNNSSLHRFCFGVWPSTGNQSTYLNGCYGHDEPGLNPYSSLPGSGGNVTWTVTLPTDRSPTQNQSDLFTAIWFGMVLNDPFAWMKECFLELQFYPDSAWGSSTPAIGNWIGAAVAWQIEASTGYENACYYRVLGSNPANGSYLNMQGGDTIRVAMVGWGSSRYGENLTITDLTNGQSAFVNMYNQAQNYPLNPSYSANDFPNALQWTPGGQLSVSFSFENGHTTNPNPNNNSYGGCSAGPPPSTLKDPAVPCPSYDPGSWANDTLTPWYIPPPVFSNARGNGTSVQFGFSHDLGGISFIDSLSNGTCTGRDGSAWCSYPWWSFSCSINSFEFGATDYTGASSDFGKYLQFATVGESDGVGNFYYPLTNVSLPACGRPSYSVRVLLAPSPDVTVHFLGVTTPSAGGNLSYTFSGLLPGNYSLSFNTVVGPPAGGWSPAGAVTVSDPNSSWTTLRVNGNGTVTPATSFAPVVRLNFTDPGGHGWQAISRGFSQPLAGAVTTVPTNGSVNVSTGPWSILAYPRPGYNFSHWQLLGGNATIAAPFLPFTWVNLTFPGNVTRLAAVFVRSNSTSAVTVTVTGPGTVDLNGVTYTAGTVQTALPVGTYSMSANPSAGNTAAYLDAYGSALVLGQDKRMNLSLENGSTQVLALFGATPVLTLFDTPGNGTISFGDAVPVGNNTSIPVPRYYGAYANDVLAVAPPGSAFSKWTVSSSSALWVRNLSAGSTRVQVNVSGTLTAHFVSATGLPLHFQVVPGNVGAIVFDALHTQSNGTTLPSVSLGSYRVHAVVPANYTFVAFNVSTGAGAVSPLNDVYAPNDAIVTLTRGNATLTLTIVGFPSRPVAVTFVASPPSANATIDGTVVTQGVTTFLSAGNHTLLGASPAGPITEWSTTANLSVLANGSGVLLLEVHGPGTLYALQGAGLDVGVSASPTVGRTPLLVQFGATIAGGIGPFHVDWAFGAGAHGTGPSINHTFTAVGRYLVHLWVNDSAGGQFVLTVPIHVLPVPVVAQVVANSTLGTVPFSVAFSGTAGGGTPGYTFQWSFGDATNGSVGSTASHVYALSGDFNAILVVVDSQGATGVSNVTIHVLLPVTVSIFTSPQGGTAPLDVTLTATGSGGRGPYSYAWGLGDGNLANGTQVVHSYLAGGTFVVNVTATDSIGDHGNYSTVVHVAPPVPALQATLTATPAILTLGGEIALNVIVVGGHGGNSFVWAGLPGGCGGANLPTIRCTPTSPGDTPVAVQVTDSAGWHVTAQAHVLVERALTTTHPSVGFWSVLGVQVGILLIILVGAVLLGVVLLRRRGRDEEVAEEEPMTAAAEAPPQRDAPPDASPDSGELVGPPEER